MITDLYIIAHSALCTRSTRPPWSARRVCRQLEKNAGTYVRSDSMPTDPIEAIQGGSPADKDFAHVSPARPHARARVPAMARCAEDTNIELGSQRPRLLRRCARAVTHVRSALAARLEQPAAPCRRQHQYDQFWRDGAYVLRSVWPMRVLGRLQPRGSA